MEDAQPLKEVLVNSSWLPKSRRRSSNPFSFFSSTLFSNKFELKFQLLAMLFSIEGYLLARILSQSEVSKEGSHAIHPSICFVVLVSHLFIKKFTPQNTFWFDFCLISRWSNLHLSFWYVVPLSWEYHIFIQNFVIHFLVESYLNSASSFFQTATISASKTHFVDQI